MVPFELHPHPHHPPRSRFIVKARVSRRCDGRHLAIDFRVHGDVDQIAWQNVAREGRADALWKHSCFEAFIGGDRGAAYLELNVAPVKQWAAYAFDDYRSGMREAPEVVIARLDYLERDLSAARVEMRVLVEMPSHYAETDWQMALSVIIEETTGTKSYWALAHASGPPDFHNRDCFIATLPALTPP